MATAYATSNYLVELAGTTGPIVLGGFAECSGLTDGGSRLAALKRGVVNSQALTLLRAAGSRPAVTITLRDERGAPLRKWQLSGVQISKFTGPTFNARGTDVAVEELSLTADGITSA